MKLGSYYRLIRNMPFHKKGRGFPDSLQAGAEAWYPIGTKLQMVVTVEDGFTSKLLKLIGKEHYSWLSSDCYVELSALEQLAMEA